MVVGKRRKAWRCPDGHVEIAVSATRAMDIDRYTKLEDGESACPECGQTYIVNEDGA